MGHEMIEASRTDGILDVARLFVPAAFRPGLRAAFERIYYFGFRHTCPFCHAHVRTFLPFGFDVPVLKEKRVVGGGYRTNSLCQRCGSNDRDRLVYLYLTLKTDIFSRPQRVLHVAPEPKLRAALSTHAGIEYVSADLNDPNVMVKVDVTQIQFPGNHFDAILCNHVLEHVTDDGRAMSELHRTLKPRGWAILQVPISLALSSTYEDSSITTPLDRERAFGQADHVRLYARDYANRLAEAGFAVDVFDWRAGGRGFGAPLNCFALNPDERIFIARKRD